MQIREAILKAADHIEANPHLYSFENSEVPDCGTPGCMVGWVAHFMGATAKIHLDHSECENLFGMRSAVFMRGLVSVGMHDLRFHRSPTDAAICLRRYALIYHPEALPDITPVLNRIFQDSRKRVAA